VTERRRASMTRLGQMARLSFKARPHGHNQVRPTAAVGLRRAAILGLEAHRKLVRL